MSFHSVPLSKDYVVERKVILNPGNNGYIGRSGLFVSPGTMTKHKMSNYWKFYTNVTDLDQTNLVKWDEVGSGGIKTMDEFSPPKSTACTATWCGKASQGPGLTYENYYVPPQCYNRPEKCAVVIHAVSNYDEAYFETLTKTLGLNMIHAYYGWSMGKAAKEMIAAGRDVLNYYWEPDPLITQLGSTRISFPDYRIGCKGAKFTADPTTGSLGCDYAGAPMEKLLTADVKAVMPENFFSLGKLCGICREPSASKNKGIKVCVCYGAYRM